MSAVIRIVALVSVIGTVGVRSDDQRKLRRHECARLYAADVQHAEHDGEYDSHGGQ